LVMSAKNRFMSVSSQDQAPTFNNYPIVQRTKLL